MSQPVKTDQSAHSSLTSFQSFLPKVRPTYSLVLVTLKKLPSTSESVFCFCNKLTLTPLAEVAD